MESKTTDLKDLLSNSQVAEVAGEAEVVEVKPTLADEALDMQ